MLKTMQIGIIDNFRVLREKSALISFLVLSRQKAALFKTYLGRFWLLLGPIGNMLIYYVMLTVVFEAGPRYGINPFLFIMLGLSHYFIVNRVLSGSAGAFTLRRNLLLQISIEPLVFYGVVFWEACVELLTFIALFAVFMLFSGNIPGPSFFVIYPAAFLILLAFSWSFGLIVAVSSVFFKDFQQLTTFAGRLLLYGSPILYPISFVPERFRDIFLLNPLAPVFGMIQSGVFGFPMPGVWHIAYAVTMAVLFCIFAHAFYNRAKMRFTKVF